MSPCAGLPYGNREKKIKKKVCYTHLVSLDWALDWKAHLEEKRVNSLASGLFSKYWFIVWVWESIGGGPSGFGFPPSLSFKGKHRVQVE